MRSASTSTSTFRSRSTSRTRTCSIPSRVIRSARCTALALVGALVVTAVALGSNGGSSAPPTGAALAALAKPPVYTSLASQRVYFVMTDRYANGDPSNDRGGLTGGAGNTGYDPV